nr:hypothetical protein [Nitrospinota bacterium]
MLKKYFDLLTALGLVLLLGSAFPESEVFAKSLTATKTEISLVDGVAVDKRGNVYISMRDNNIISRIDLKGNMTTFAGTGSSGFSGDSDQAVKARLNVPAGLAFDKSGNLFIADRNNHRIRKVDSRGIITTIAGTGTEGFSGDGGPATQAQLNHPSGIAFDGKGNLFFSDRSNERIRMIDSNGKISTYAGNGKEGFKGDSGPALQASLDKPFGIAFDRKGNLYIADRGNNRVRKVNTQGIITTVAGDGGFFFMGDNGPAYRASVAGPTGVVVDD